MTNFAPDIGFDVYITLGDESADVLRSMQHGLVEAVEAETARMATTVATGQGEWNGEDESSLVVIYLAVPVHDLLRIYAAATHVASAHLQEAFGFAPVPAGAALHYVKRETHADAIESVGVR